MLYDVKDGVGAITLNRPAVLNALNKSLAAALADAAEEAARDPNVWVIVVRGAGRAFSSGMDRTALAAGQVEEPFYRHWIRGLNGLEDAGKPVLAAIHGYCIGGGLQLALACDFRLATADGVLGLGATRHGLIPDGAVLRLARVVGIGRAKELALLNDEVTAAEARAIGLVNWVAPPGEFEAAVKRIVDKCFQASPTAFRHTKRLLHESFHVDPRSLIEEVVKAQNECMTSGELTEANRAWEERREARFFPQRGR
ncbi:MAG: enoyl-CoA hydratase/isomerase family protein [Candidatus Rokubacteria bacterium]|nr:enoyl-CoA hydratase/isomerase family protein [Candidatus Rokubacteria bacterium]